jgi:hypothetical protein
MTPARPLPSRADADVPGAALARFAEARGHRVFQALGAHWVEYRPFAFMALRNPRWLDLDPHDLGRTLRSARVGVARYFTQTQPGLSCVVYGLTLAGYSLARAHPKHRRVIRRGLEITECRLLDPDELLALGLEVNLDTMARHGRFDPELGEPARWRRFVLAVRRCPEVSTPGAFIDGRLASYHVNCRDGDWLHLLYKMNRTEDLSRKAAAALDFWELAHAAEDPSLQGVECGHASVAGLESLHFYKTHLGFDPVPARLAIGLHPALQPLVANRFTAGVATAIWKLRPGHPGLERVAATLKCAQAPVRGGGAALRDVGETEGR